MQPGTERTGPLKDSLEPLGLGLALLCLLLLLAEGVQGLRVPGFLRDDVWQGVQFVSALRVYEGLPLYPDYAEQGSFCTYGPVLPLVQAALMHLGGVSLEVLEAGAFVACLAALGALFLGARRRGGSNAAGLLAVGLFAAFHPFSGNWYFNIRPDGAATALSLWGLLAATRGLERDEHAAGPVLAASTAFALAALCKANYLLLGVGYLLYLARRVSWRAAGLGVLPLLALHALALLGFARGQEHYLATQAVLARIPPHGFGHSAKLLHDLFLGLAIPTALALATCLLPTRSEAAGKHARAWPLALAASFALGVIPALKTGGGPNSLVLFLALLALVVGSDGVLGGEGEAGLHSAVRLRVSLCLVLFLALATGRAAARLALESPVDVSAERAFLAAHRDQRVYYPWRNYVAHFAAGQVGPSAPILWDRSRAGLSPPRGLVADLQARAYDIIVGGFDSPRADAGGKLTELNEVLHRHYRPRAGGPVGGLVVYVPRN